MSQLCQWKTQDGNLCSRPATATISGIALCDTHRPSVDLATVSEAIGEEEERRQEARGLRPVVKGGELERNRQRHKESENEDQETQTD